MLCNICQTELGSPLFESPSNQALTSLCELRPGRVRVWLCPTCGHLLGETMPNNTDYYATDYRILLDHDDEDQIYEVQDGAIIYRTDHQIATLLDKLDLPQAARLLDYGCAKASTPQRLLIQRPDLQVHLFDVSEMYVGHWKKFLTEDRWSMHETPTDWLGSFDVITSFFALEHIPDPIDSVRRVASLLTEKGVFYGIVPDTFGNVADFVVIDHVNHFTKCSLHTLLLRAGFTDIVIDSVVHRGALVFKARKTGPASVGADLGASLIESHTLADYWVNLGDRIRNSEYINQDKSVAIYGSGFYGAYIASMLQHPEKVHCFLDASPYQQGKTLMGYTILPPHQLPEQVSLLYVGLNPKIAKAVTSEMNWLKGRNLSMVFLD